MTTRYQCRVSCEVCFKPRKPGQIINHFCDCGLGFVVCKPCGGRKTTDRMIENHMGHARRHERGMARQGISRTPAETYQRELKEAEGLIAELREQLGWCGGSGDFSAEGQAGKAWAKHVIPLLRRVDARADLARLGLAKARKPIRCAICSLTHF